MKDNKIWRVENMESVMLILKLMNLKPMKMMTMMKKTMSNLGLSIPPTPKSQDSFW